MNYTLSAEAASSEQHLAALAQVLAHRMRGPLTSIQCYTEMLADTVGTCEERDMLLRIFESVSSLEKTLADLHRYSVQVDPSPRVLDARQLMEDALTGLGDAGAGVVFDGAAGLEVWGDPLLVQQALLILFENALDAAYEAGGSIEEPAVHCAVRREPAAPDVSALVRFEVWNAGAYRLDVEQAFAPFFTTKSSNLGIGLSIARRIAEAHGGRLSLSTTSGSSSATGVTFTLLLPAPPENYTE